MPETPVIQAENLVYSVPGKTILNGVSMSISKGEILGIVGGSGSGKSTLIKCLAGLLGAQSGSITVNGRELVGSSERNLLEIRNGTGFVFQYSALFDSMSVFENCSIALTRRLGYSLGEAYQVVQEKLGLVGLDDVAKLMPSQLSGGMAKRVSLARALAHEPGILFYDEPTSGLDPPSARTIDKLIEQLREKLGVTSLVVSHDLSALAKFADRIALIDEGKLALLAPTEQFMASDHPVVKRFVKADQLEEYD